MLLYIIILQGKQLKELLERWRINQDYIYVPLVPDSIEKKNYYKHGLNFSRMDKVTLDKPVDEIHAINTNTLRHTGGMSGMAYI